MNCSLRGGLDLVTYHFEKGIEGDVLAGFKQTSIKRRLTFTTPVAGTLLVPLFNLEF